MFGNGIVMIGFLFCIFIVGRLFLSRLLEEKKVFLECR